jgi:hypothetical protein
VGSITKMERSWEGILVRRLKLRVTAHTSVRNLDSLVA